jgi:hypothetical protein
MGNFIFGGSLYFENIKPVFPSLFRFILFPFLIIFTIKKQIEEVNMPNKKSSKVRNELNFEKEIKMLDLIYSDMVEAIQGKPVSNKIDDLRLYVDNIYSVLNKTAIRVKEVKNDLLADEKFIHETWNPPA